MTSRTARPIAQETGLPREGVEVLHAGDEGGGDLRRRHHRAHRMPVADRLAQRDDVGHHAVALEAPEVLADAAEPDLHLIGHAHPAGGPHLPQTRAVR